MQGSDGPHCLLQASDARPLAAWSQRVPKAVVRSLMAPGSCLVVGDAPGDPDCFCSAAALARARNNLGLKGLAHVNAPPPKQIAPVLRAGEIAGSDDIEEQRFDTVVFVDNDATRVGPAAQEAMKRAQRVIIIDHHEVDPTHEQLGLPEDVELIVWKETGADAAALMVLAATARMSADSPVPLSEAGWADVVRPLVSAMYSDTRGFEASRTRPTTVGLLMQLVDTGALSLRATLAGFGGGVAPQIRDRLYAQVQEDRQQFGAQTLGAFSLDASALVQAWQDACAQTPETTWSDMLFLALDHVEARTREAGYDVSVFAAGAQDAEATADLEPAVQGQLPPAPTKFSVRTKEGPLAPALAAHLGGGGKPHEGGGISKDSAQDILHKASHWMQERAELARFAAARNLGGA